MRRRAAKAAAVLALGAALVAPAPAGALRTIEGLQDARYCEVLALHGAIPDARVDVWNTVGFSDCPDPLWSALDPTALAAQIGAAAVILNGPRHFLMDSASGKGGRVRTLGGLRTRLVATIPIRTAADLVQRPYAERSIARKNVWEWRAGQTVFELLAPGGARYVMQSYSNIRDPDLSLTDLPALGARLTLPAGWSYRARVLEDDLILAAKDTATIVQDDLLNTYQRMPE